jgi:hypothetical protein
MTVPNAHGMANQERPPSMYAWKGKTASVLIDWRERGTRTRTLVVESGREAIARCLRGEEREEKARTEDRSAQFVV